MKYSIIVPVYNVEKYLRKCVESIERQDYTYREIILIDDGSTDSSGIICDEYKRKYNDIKVIHKKNGGLSDARNKGIEVAMGDYIVFVDSDDWIEQGILSTFAQILESEQPHVLDTVMVESYEDGSEVIKDDGLEKYLSEGFNENRAISWIFNISKNTWCAPKRIYKKSLLIENNLRFEKGRLHEDMDWTCNICYVASKYSACPIPWYYHRMGRRDSINNNITSKNIIDVIEMASWHYKYWKTHRDWKTDIIIDRVLRSVYQKINQIRLCEAMDQEVIFNCLEKNKIMLSVAPEAKYKLYSFVGRIFGYRNATKLLSIGKGKW